MATQVTPRAMPTDRPPDIFTSPVFPRTKCSLWDKTSTGQTVFLHLGYYRKPTVCIPEKILRLVQHQCENYGQLSHMLIGSLVVEDDGEGVQFQVDRLDTRPNIPPDGSGLAPGDLLIPLEVANNSAKERSGTVEDYACALKRLQDRCCSKDSIDLCSFLLLRGWGSFYSNAHTSVAHLDFDMVTMATVFKATPIMPVPIVLTALSKNLAGPMSLSQMQGSPKSGYLTMDHTRKLLLVLESDPKTSTLPVVGIWISGVEFVQHPFVWAACLRYIHNSHLQDRVCTPPEEFLLVLYSKLHSRPEFYQCDTTSGNVSLQFELYSGHEVTNMTKALTSPKSENFSEVEMGPVDAGTKMEIFDAAKAKHGLHRANSEMEDGWMNKQEDIEPRSAPTPHADKVPVFHPVVPDVSILWTEPSETYNSVPKSSFSSPYNNSIRHPQSSNFPFIGAKSVISHSVPNPSMSSSSFRQPLPGQGGFSLPGQQVHSQGYQNFHSHSQSLASQVQPPLSQQYSPQSQAQEQPLHFQPLPSQTAPSQFHGQHLPASASQTPSAVQFSMTQRPSNFQQSAQASSLQGGVPSVSAARILPGGPHGNPPNSGLSSLSPQINMHQSTQSTSHFPTYQTARIDIPPGSAVTAAQPSRNTSCQWDQQPPHIYNPQHTVNRNNNFPFATESERNRLQTYNSNNQGQMGSSVGNHVILPQQMQAQRMPHSVPSNIMFTPAPNSNQTSLTHEFYDNLPPSSTTAMTSCGRIVATGNTRASKQTHPPPCHPSSTRDCQNPMTFLKTVLEETSPSSSSSGSLLSQAAGQAEDRKSMNTNISHSDMTIASCHGANTSESGHSNTNNSGRSSDDDSGLSVTPDRHNPSPEEQAVMSSSSLTVGPSLPKLVVANSIAASTQPSIDNVNWNQVPPEIRTLLIQQNEQLKQLQQQIQVLLHNQSQSSAQSSPSSLGRKDHSTTCSVAVNTTGTAEDSIEKQSRSHNSYDHRSVQTSPLKPLLPAYIGSPVSQQESVSRGRQEDVSDRLATPSDIRHNGPMPMNSTAYEDGQSSQNSVTAVHKSSGEPSQTSSEDDLNQGALVDAMASLPVCEHTVNSVASEMLVDMPDYVSSYGDRSQFEPSSASVGDFPGNCPDESYSTVAEDASDPKQYYSQLMKNIQMFLTNSDSQDTESGDQTFGQAEMTLEASSVKCAASANSTFVPQVNYMSMMLGCGSDSSQSMEINAMAMKYLSDEQLTYMAKLRQNSSKQSQQPGYSTKILQRVIGGGKLPVSGSCTPDVSRLGISPNDMTMGTQKYLEKHGLLGNDTSVLDPAYNHDCSMWDDMFKLKTDFSMMTNGSDALRANGSPLVSSKDPDIVNSSGQNMPGTPGPLPSPAPSPVRKEIIRTKTSTVPGNNDQWVPNHVRAVGVPKDLGASPVLRTPKQYQRGGTVNGYDENHPQSPEDKGIIMGGRNKNNIFQEVKPQAYRNYETRGMDSKDSATTVTSEEEEEEENILDIEKLKQLPKLL